VAALTTMDILLETVLVHYTGGAFSQFALLYFLSIVSGSVFFQLRGTLVLATLAAVAYVGLVVAEAVGLVTPAGGAVPAVRPTGMVVAFHAGLNVVTFYLVAFLSGQLSLKVERRRRMLETATEELRAARLDTDQIIENLASGLLTLDMAGRITHLNRAGEAILGVRAADVTGAFQREALAQSAPALVSLLEQTLSERQASARVEVTVTRRDGTKVPVGLSLSFMARSGPDTEPRGLIAIFQDLTESRRIEESLRRADRLAAIGEISAGIAHEIRNPLASICGAAQILGAELSVKGEEERLLRLVVREADRLNRFVGDFLAYAKSRSRQVSLVALEPMLADVKNLIESHPKFPRGIRIEVEVPEGEHFAEADAEEIKRVFLNLAQNAVEAMGPSGTLAIELGAPEPVGDGGADVVTITFRDTGPGVPESERDAMFKPFVTGKKGGTGLGLAIAQKIVEEHKGEIRYESAPGGGAAFVVELPGVAVPAEAAAARA
jgi:two-component system sensor histidine kinase PilS (NtrC family)